MYEAKKDNWSMSSSDRNIELNINLQGVATIGRVYQK